MKIIVCQKDEVCNQCQKELPKGEIAWADPFDNTLICDECRNSNNQEAT